MVLNRKNNNSILSVKQASEVLGICPATLKNWIKLGKITASKKGSSYILSEKDVLACARTLESGDMLRSRRNKRLSDSNFIPRSYIDTSSPNYRTIIDIVEASRSSMAAIEDILYCYAKSLIEQQGLSDESLIRLTSGITPHPQITNDPVFSYRLIPILSEDTLGMLYLSLRGLRSKKASGAYYTPFYAVDVMCRNAFEAGENTNKTVCDPACGTGNFLLRLPDDIGLDHVYGYDIDPLAVAIARINIVFKYRADDARSLDIICNNIQVKDFLSQESSSKFDTIIGNPPWGYGFSATEASLLRKTFRSAKGTGRPESFSLFIEKALMTSREICFLIPETFLESDTYKSIRKIILEEGSVKKLSYLGEIFDKVQCPCIILNVSSAKNNDDVQVAFYNRRKKCLIRRESFLATQTRLSSDSFQIICDDLKYGIIKKMKAGNNFYLKGNADFALGIVTGNNKELVKPSPASGLEGIIKGTDIEKYFLKEPTSYVKYVPDTFQQTAPTKYYRNKDKLFYKFIASQPILAKDDKGYVSLNSANILIPKVPGYSSDYIMAVLNSSCISFYYRCTCRNMKVLRARLESLPIPLCDDETMKKIHQLTGEITVSLKKGLDSEAKSGILELNTVIAGLFDLTDEEIQVISNDY